MFRKVRKIKNEISEQEARVILKEGKRAVLSVNGDDGYPYAIPVNYYYDEEENRIYIHGSKAGHKIDAINADNKVCFTVYNDGYLEEGDWAYHVSSTVVFGRASIIKDEEKRFQKVLLLTEKYYPTKEMAKETVEEGFAYVNLIAIDIEHISGKKVHEK